MTPAIFDDFLPDIDAVREHALHAPYIDWLAPDGEVYKRIWIGDVPGLLEAIEAKMGPVQMLGMGYRLNYAGELPNAAIHSDLGWGTHALVLYLCDGDGGTAFWKHRATGAETIYVGDVDLFEKVRNDWNDAAQWEQRSLVPLRLNRATIYESALFHSRYPFEAFGSTPEDGRLVAVAFFNLREHS
jgi:hypothetical protein